MASYSDKETDKALKALEQNIVTVYDQAWSEVSKIASDYFATFKERYEKEYEAYQDGKYTKAQFDAWYLSQVGRGQRWEAVRDELGKRLTEANQIAAAYINDTTPGIYSLNANYEAYQIEQATGVDFTIYDERTVADLMKGNTKILPESRVNESKSDAWNMKQLSNALASGIMQGKSIDSIADSFQRVSDMDRNSAVRNARTAVTGAQNAGRQDSYERAQEMGIEMEKEWIATIDERTRESHAELDGVRVKVDEEFPNGLMYPGDSRGDPGEVYNCRCTQRAIIGKYNGEARESQIEGHEGEHTKETYNEWLDRKREEKMSEGPYTSADATFRAIEDAEDRAESNEKIDNAKEHEVNDLQENNINHYGAKDTPPGEPSPTWQEGKVDFENKQDVMERLNRYEDEFLKNDYESCVTVTSDGVVWVSEGSQFDVSPVIDGSMEGAYTYHNHTPDMTEYSFSASDIGSFLENKVGYSKASDDVYEYYFARTSETKIATNDEISFQSSEIYRNIVMQMAFNGEIDPNYDVQHEVVKRLAEIYQFEYEREKK